MQHAEGTRIDSKHPAWAETLAASEGEYKSTVHHFIVVEGKAVPVFYSEVKAGALYT